MFLVVMKDCFLRAKEIKVIYKYEENGKYSVQIFIGDTLNVKNTFEDVESRDAFYENLCEKMSQAAD